VVERNLSFGGTVVLVSVLAGAVAGCLINPGLFHAVHDTVLGWGIGSSRLSTLICFLPVLLAGAAAGHAFDFLTGQGLFAKPGPVEKPAE
jgi:hypothetical protein